jgi:hypothetical protein
LSSGTISVENGPVKLNITNVKQLRISEPILSTSSNVRLHIIELPKLSGELDMGLIGQTSGAENDNSVL